GVHELRARAERHALAGLDLDGLTGPRVAALAGLGVGHAEAAEAAQAHLLALGDRRLHGFEYRVQSARRLRLGHAGPLRDLLRDIAFAEHYLASLRYLGGPAAAGPLRRTLPRGRSSARAS